MKNQIQISFPKVKVQVKEPLRYCHLNIDQKINCKANSAGFQSTYLKDSLPYFRNHKVLFRSHDAWDGLNYKWFWHHKHNKNRPWDAVAKGELFRKSKQHVIRKRFSTEISR